MFSCICRYHYNVADSRLCQHVEKGNEDGLYISCVASAVNLWALIMDAGTGFSSQVYELSAVFLHKVIFEFFDAAISVMNSCLVTLTTIFDSTLSGLDYGTMGKELLHQFNSWCC